MDHQFLNIDCHPPPLPRPTPHPSYGGPTGGMYSLDVRQSPDVAPSINQFNPYRLSSTADGNSHATLPSSQFVLDSFYKAYQSAYGQNSALAAAGAMFGHPSYRLDNTLLSTDQQLMLQASFLQYPHLGMFPNPALYASLPGSSAVSRYHSDYFGQNLSNLSSFQNPSKYSSSTDLTSASSWMGFDRASSASMMSNFIATSLPSDSIKDDSRISDSPFKKMNESDQISYGNQQASNALLKRKSTEDIGLMFRQYSSSTMLDEKSSKKGNGELAHTNRKSDEKKIDSFAQSGKESCQIYHNQKRSSSSLKVPKSPAFSSVSCSEPAHINDGLPSKSENSELNCSFDHRNESNNFHHVIEPLNLQSKAALGVTNLHQYSDKKLSENLKHDITNLKLSKSEAATVRSNLISGTDSRDVSSYSSRKTTQIYECKFHRPFELAPGKQGHEVTQTRNKVEAIPKNITKTLSDDHRNEKNSNSNRLPYRSLSLCSTSYGHDSQNVSKTFSCNVSTFNSTNSSVVSSQMCSSAKKSSGAGLSLKSISSKSVTEEVPLNLALIKDSERLSTTSRIPNCSYDTNVITAHKLVSKLDFEAAWRHAKGLPKYWRCSADKFKSDKFDDCDFDYELKTARLTTIISGPKLSSSNNSPEKIDFLSTLGLSTVDKCKEIQFEKHKRRKFQARESSVSPTLLNEDEDIGNETPFTDEFTRCSEDCPHNNGLDKHSMLALLGLSYTGSCNPKSEKYLVHGKSYSNSTHGNKPVSLLEPLSSSLTGTLLSYHNHSSLSYSHPLSDSFYSAESSSLSLSYPLFSSQSIYPSSQLPSSSIYSFYSATSQQFPLNQSSFASPSYRHHLYETPSKVTPSYTCRSNHLLDEPHQLYYQQGKEERNFSKIEPTVGIDGSSYIDYNNYDDHNFLDASLENVLMSRCISSTPASHHHHHQNLRDESNAICENVISLENIKNIDNNNSRARPLDGTNFFNWPGIDSVIESYHQYIEERSLERKLLSEHSAKLCKINSDLFNAQEELRNKIFDLKNTEMKLDSQRSATQSQIESLKNIITQLK